VKANGLKVFVILQVYFLPFKEGKEILYERHLDCVSLRFIGTMKRRQPRKLSDPLGALKAFLKEERVNNFKKQVMNG